MIDDRHEFVIARTLKRLYPQNPDVVLGREARNIVADLSAAGYQLVTDLFVALTEDIKAENERLRAAITVHHERIKTLGLNTNRGVPQWGGPWDHELWAALGLPSGPDSSLSGAQNG